MGFVGSSYDSMGIMPWEGSENSLKRFMEPTFNLSDIEGSFLGSILCPLGLGGGGEENNPFQGILDSMDLVIGKNDDLLGSFQKSMGGIEGLGGKAAGMLCRFLFPTWA